MTQAYNFLPLTSYYPVNDDNEMRVAIEKDYESIAKSVNLRDIGIYDFPENQNGQTWFTADAAGNIIDTRKRNGFRKVFYFHTLANFPAATTQPHGMGAILPTATITRISGATTYYNPVGPVFLSVPIAMSVGNMITAWLDATNINISAQTNQYDGHKAIVIVEYLVGY